MGRLSDDEAVATLCSLPSLPPLPACQPPPVHADLLQVDVHAGLLEVAVPTGLLQVAVLLQVGPGQDPEQRQEELHQLLAFPGSESLPALPASRPSCEHYQDQYC